MMRPKRHCTTRQGKIIISDYSEMLYKGLYSTHHSPVSLCEIVLVKQVYNNIIFVEIHIVCGSHSEAETQVDLGR